MAVTSTGGAAAPGSDQAANTIFAGPATGAAAATQFRAMVNADLPFTVPISNANLFNQGSDDLAALTEMGSVIKGWCPGSIQPISAGSFTLTSTAVLWAAIYVPVATTLTGCKVVLGQSGVYTSTGYNGVALYTLNASTGLLTQVAASTSSTTAWTPAPGFIPFPFSATYAATEGVYFLAMLYQRSAETTPPRLSVNSTGAIFSSRDFPNNIKLVGTTTNTILPATQTSVGINVTSVFPYLYLY